MDRRKFLNALTTTSALAVAGCSLNIIKSDNSSNVSELIVARMKTVRFGFIGVGRRGGNTLLRLMLNIDGASVVALCDTHQATLEKNSTMVKEMSGVSPALYGDSDFAYKKMLEREDIDAVIIATPWKWHTPMAVDAMLAGKHAFVEVPAALTVDECWQLVEVSEQTQRNCMMLENVCYGRNEMMVLNMVRDKLFGDLTHGEAAYIHELRWQMKDIETGTGSWRTQWHAKRNANLYPTHGLGPIAQYMNINRGDKFDYLVSMSSPALGRQRYAQQEFAPNHLRNTQKYIAGDMNSTMIKTSLGRSILIQHDTTTPRPYTRLNLIQGTNGTFAGYPNRIALENNPLTPDTKDGFHHWDTDMEKWYAKYDHELWKKLHGDATEQGGHGGMDFIMLWRMVYCLRNALPLDQNVYDAAAWSAVIDLSERSVNTRSSSVTFPDFTRGNWKTNRPLS
jgi:predicted dehydrogenase